MERILSVLLSRSAMLVIAAICAFVVMAPAASAREPVTAKSFEGIWKVTKVVSPDGAVDERPQPSLVIFSRGYFSVIRDTGSGPRVQAPAPKDLTKLTDEEKLGLYQEWANFGASGGTYEIKGDTLVTRNDIAKMVRGVGLIEQAIVTFEGETFTAQPKPGEPNAGRLTTYTRIR